MKIGKIEKDIPIPDRAWPKGRAKSEIRLAIDEMIVGDSLLVNGNETIKQRVRGIIRNLKMNNKELQFITRETIDGKGIRIWKTK